MSSTQTKSSSRSTKSRKAAVATVAETELPVATPTSSRSSKSRTRKAVVQDTPPVQEVVTADTSSKSRQRTVVERDELLDEGERLLTMATEELQRLRDTSKDTKFLRDYLKLLKSYNKNVTRFANQKQRRPKREVDPDRVCIFNVPVPVTNELTDFCGWERGSLHSRSEVTKAVSQYIREHNLKSPNNGKFIEPDTKLARLLKYDSRKHEPLTFALLQKYLALHYPK